MDITYSTNLYDFEAYKPESYRGLKAEMYKAAFWDVLKNGPVFFRSTDFECINRGRRDGYEAYKTFAPGISGVAITYKENIIHV